MTNEKSQIPKYPTQSFDNGDDSIWDILVIIARQIKVIVITPTIICIISILHVQFFTAPIYQSTVRIMSSLGNTNVSQANNLAAQFGINLPIQQSGSQWGYSEILKSRTLARAMLKRKFDTKEYGPQKSLLQILTYGNEKLGLGLDTIESQAVYNLLKIIDVNEDKRTKIFTVTLTASEPRFASELNKALIEELDIHQRVYNQKKTSETRQFIEGRIISTEKELQSAEEGLKDFRDRNRRIENSPALLLKQQRLAREVSVLTGVFTTLKQQLENTKIAEVKESNYVIVLDPPEVPLVPSAPNKRQIVIFSGLLGIGLGMGFGFLKDYAEKTDNVEKRKIEKVKSLFLKNILDLLSFKSKK